KILFDADYLLNTNKESWDLKPKEYFGRPIMLPPCFFYYNPCSKKYEKGSSFFFEIEDKIKPSTAPNTTIQNDAGCLDKKDVDRDDCECIPNNKCVSQNLCCATIKPYITDLMIVKDEVKCYVPGELSYLENVLEGEKRIRKHRHLERTEEYNELKKEISDYSERDHQVTEKFSLQKETSETIKQDLKLDAGVTFTAKYGTGAMSSTLSTDFNSTYDWSKETTNKIAQDYSKDVVDRALSKVEQKMSELVTQKQIIETEENNKHVFNNVGDGKDNISGQYFFVNKISKAQVYNYGKRLICDVFVPEPSELYKRLLEKQFKLKEPIKPTITPTQITSDNYIDFVLLYNLKDVEFPPEMIKDIRIHIEGTPGDPGEKLNGWLGYNGSGLITRSDLNVQIPDNFEAISIRSELNNLSWNTNQGDYLKVTLGGPFILYPKSGTAITSYNLSTPLEGIQPIGFRVMDCTNYDLNLVVHCTLKGEQVLKWQQGIYNKIMEAYEKEKKEYDEAFAEYERNKAIKHNRNPFLNRETERIELKRMAISYISCKFYDDMDAMKNKVKPCGFPQMDLEETEREGRWVRFFEQAFEWPLTTYLFYPYFWGRKCTWVDKIKESADDPIFEKFLQSGFARLQIPVRPGFEEQIQYFLTFGKIWEDSDLPPIPGDPYYVSLAQEIREQKGNFYADRDGTLEFKRVETVEPDTPDPNYTVALTDDEKHYWDGINNSINQDNINSDIDREIIIDCKVYRIVSIAEDEDPTNTEHTKWIITLDREYEGDDFSNMKWSTGAVYIGAPWEFAIPTKLVWLRGKSKCLPCLPLKCEE
ncbi:MAG: hypothetical protein H8D45_27385, partial [Bacteroidetes bacterium]|nr:hypothetical protein [Bacteroidota bacterium]